MDRSEPGTGEPCANHPGQRCVHGVCLDINTAVAKPAVWKPVWKRSAVDGTGSLLTFTRAAADPKPLPYCAIFTVRSEGGWNGTYEVADAKNATFPIGLEDSFMWQDPRGHFHALFHSFIHGAEGGHAFSDAAHIHFTKPCRSATI